MRSCEGGRIRGGWPSGVKVRLRSTGVAACDGWRWAFTTDGWLPLAGAVLVTGCGVGTLGQVSGAQTDAVVGVTQAAGAADETAVAAGAQDEWQAVRLDEMAVDRSDPESERRNPFRFRAPRRSLPQPWPGGGDEPGAPVEPGPGGDPPDLVSVQTPRGGTTDVC